MAHRARDVPSRSGQASRECPLGCESHQRILSTVTGPVHFWGGGRLPWISRVGQGHHRTLTRERGRSRRCIDGERLVIAGFAEEGTRASRRWKLQENASPVTPTGLCLPELADDMRVSCQAVQFGVTQDSNSEGDVEDHREAGRSRGSFLWRAGVGGPGCLLGCRASTPRPIPLLPGPRKVKTNPGDSQGGGERGVVSFKTPCFRDMTGQ